MNNIHGKITLQKVPLLRLLLSIIVGIVVQYYFNVHNAYYVLTAIISVLVFSIFGLIPSTKKISLKPIEGISLIIFFVSLGALLCYQKNQTHEKEWIGKYYQAGLPVMVTLQEPLVVRAKSFKTLAKAEAILINNQWQPIKGGVLLYFSKENINSELKYGSQIIITNPLVEIENANNPGGFNYKEYCLFQHIYYQTFLKQGGYKTLLTSSTNFLGSLIINTRSAILSIIRNNINNPAEQSVAEALLIGYRDDLDKDLVQAYNNTGVIHIIIISGLRMGMIYGLLIFLFRPFKSKKWAKLVKPIVIFLVLWGFCLIAGAAPSATRSTVMFSFILLGESLNRKTNIYNNLALSALIILLINPFSLWDAGFQLSYAAVLSIILFYRHIHSWLYLKNKSLEFIWSLSAVTLSAQILTLPLILFHFHQLPTLFLFTNVLAVPFSCIILYVELLLVIFSPFTFLAGLLGRLTGWMLALMNEYIINVNNLPFSVWSDIHVDLPQVLLLYGFIIGIVSWLLYKNKKGALLGMLSFLFFLGYGTIDIYIKLKQQKMIVYNISQHSAIDIIDGNKYLFVGDSVLKQEGFLTNFHLKPSRILNRITAADTLSSISFNQNIIQSNHKIILIINTSFIKNKSTFQKLKFDAIIITNNADVTIKDINAAFDCNLYVFDASSANYKVTNWIKDATLAHQPYYSVAEKGTFQMAL